MKIQSRVRTTIQSTLVGLTINMNEFLLLLVFLLCSASSSATDPSMDDILTEVNATSRQYNCGSTGTVVVNKGFQVT